MSDEGLQDESDKLSQLLIAVEKLTHSYDSLREDVYSIRNSLIGINLTQTDTNNRINKVENEISSLVDKSRSKNLVLFGLEDSDASNKSLIPSIQNFFATLNCKYRTLRSSIHSASVGSEVTDQF